MSAQTAFSQMNDEQLVHMAQQGNSSALDAIMSRYRDFVSAKVRAYYIVGADKDDLIQEGMIGLYKAVCDFDEKRSDFFKPFAGVCISRRIISAVKSANRRKHMPLNSYVSLDKNVYEDEDSSYMEMVKEPYDSNPEAIIINREDMYDIENRINKALSKLELQVLVYYLRGLNYREISELIGKDVKSVDNAIQRIRRKLEAILKN